MKLSDELFRDVVAALKLPDSRAPRVPVVGRATIIPCGPKADHRPAAVVVRDVSPTGIGMAHLRSMDLGEPFLICLPATNAASLRLIVCSVVHCQPIGQGLFAIGANFTHTLSPGTQLPVLPVEGLVAAFRKEAASALKALEEGDEQFHQIETRLTGSN